MPAHYQEIPIEVTLNSLALIDCLIMSSSLVTKQIVGAWVAMRLTQPKLQNQK